VVATMNFRKTNLMNVANMVAEVLEEHRNSTLVIERNRAQALIDHLLIELPKRGIDPFKRIYNTLVNDQTVRRAEFEEMMRTPLGQRSQEFYDNKRTCFGFWTGTKSRDLLYGTVLQEAAKNTGWLTRDQELIGQITTLVAKNERVDHKSGNHDDLVIAWLLGYWFMFEGRHHDWYGIEQRKVMSIKERQSQYTQEEEAWLDEQETFKAELNTLMDQLKTATNPMIVARLEKRLMFVKSKITYFDGESSTIDQLLQEAREARALRARTSKINQNPLRRGMGYRPPIQRRGFPGVGMHF